MLLCLIQRYETHCLARIFSEILDTSNWGDCVGIYAPGQNIWSAWVGADDSKARVTGTSSASPFVAGAVALYLERDESMTPAKIRQSLQNDASQQVVDGNGGTTEILSLNVKPLLS